MLRKAAVSLLTPLGALAVLVMLVALPWWALLAGAALLTMWLAFARSGQLTWSVTQVGLATLPRRCGPASVVVVGIAGVVGVLVALFSMAQGFQSTLHRTGSDQTVIVLRAGSQNEINSVLNRDTALLVADEPQVQRDAASRPVASAELLVAASLPKKDSGVDASVQLRGIAAEAWKLRPAARIVSGRRFTPGLRELVVGKAAAREFAHVAVGSRLELRGQPWTVVGEFDSGGAHDSELWADAGVVASTYRRGDSISSVTVRLRSPGSFEAFRKAVTGDPRLRVDAETTRAYYDRQSETLTRTIRILGATVAIIMAIGAVFGALNTMYAAVAARTREIATLRAIGFRGGPVVLSVLIETLLLAILGGTIGAAMAWALFDHYTASTLGHNFTQVVFEFRVTPALVAAGLKWALAIGLLGGLFPALRAARVAVTSGLTAM